MNLPESNIFCLESPSHQNAVNLFAGSWKSNFPADSGIEAGNAPTFAATGVVDFVEKSLGTLSGLSVLELGPFEGYYTLQLESRGATPVVGIEINGRNYLKCLVVKEVLGLRARFLLGDFMQHDTSGVTYDLCFAAGVLYHQIHPLSMLAKIAEVADAMYIWTHYFDEALMADAARYPHFDPAQNHEVTVDGYTCLYHFRHYQRERDSVPDTWSGGAAPYSCWLERDDIFAFLRRLGFGRFLIRQEVFDHALGPHISFVAKR